MKQIEIIVNGEAFPCEPTMGAMLRFRQETGKEITDIDPKSLTDLCTYIYCCVVSAAKRHDKKFDMSLMEFADNLSPDDLAQWSAMMAEQKEENPGGKNKKKAVKASSNS